MSGLYTSDSHSIVVASGRGLNISTFKTMEDLADAAVCRLARGKFYDEGIAYLDQKIHDFTELRDKLKREMANEMRNERRAAKKARKA